MMAAESINSNGEGGAQPPAATSSAIGGTDDEMIPKSKVEELIAQKLKGQGTELQRLQAEIAKRDEAEQAREEAKRADEAKKLAEAGEHAKLAEMAEAKAKTATERAETLEATVAELRAERDQMLAEKQAEVDADMKTLKELAEKAGTLDAFKAFKAALPESPFDAAPLVAYALSEKTKGTSQQSRGYSPPVRSSGAPLTADEAREHRQKRAAAKMRGEKVDGQ